MTILKLQNIHYISDNTNIINGINLDINEGECISIVGPSGSGKSTLLKLCSDLISPSQGDLFFKNKNYKEYNPTELRKKISYCVQIPYLFGETVYDNLSYPFETRKEDVNKIKILEYLYKFNLDESYINKDVNSLSGGEKQRIALIRNLIYKPEILLLDEVTSALDKDNLKIVEGIIKDMNKSGTTVIWITHNIEQSKSIFNRKITIEDGIIENEEELN
ncbi:ABC transporter ATP-binding protein [Romboutsia sp.]|uniref:ABC transporter ATP-binding protein n=1 Tax=Romboutsia sp. TaxID=1965302 RepID=UPI003F3C33E1